ncbi:MAG: hypothetical protein F6K17_10285 [Okeania sp. SIO3C4]|nr:hypothetical protein [Okeania sp. SIO3B3]NER02985.1 hypothetical protein [Okeania sp. SIO3C4]
MKLKYLKLITASAITLGSFALAIKPSISQLPPGQRGFFCDTSEGIPTTIYQNSQGGREPWIKWESNVFKGYDPLTRCKQVSRRLEIYRVNRQLKYITAGMMNRQKVICTASQVNGRCEGLIFTLKPGQDVIKTLNNFLAWREGQAGTPSMSESAEIPYIDVSKRIEAENTPSLAPNTQIENPQTSPEETPTNSDLREL